MKILVQDTTEEERKQYVHELFHCHHGDCENCGVCMIFKGKSPVDVFHDYIEGEKEFFEIAKTLHQ